MGLNCIAGIHVCGSQHDVAGPRACCGSQPGGCGSATYLCSDVCGMLLTSNRVYTAYELGFATWDRGSYFQRCDNCVAGPQPGCCGSQPMSAETVSRFF